MSVPLIINGVTFQYPQEFDKHWGPVLTNWSTAVTTGMLQTSGVNAATLIKSATANPSSTGFLRLAKTDAISWRNNANSADLPLAINGSNQLTFNGTPIGASTALTDGHIFVGNVSNQPGDVAMSGDITITNGGVTSIGAGKVTNAMVNASAAIAVSKLAALTASKIVVSDGSGFLSTTSSPTLTELGYLSGVTSAIQTQLNAITGAYLPLAGGTMSGVLNMGAHKIVSTTQGANAGEVVVFPVNTAQIASNAITQSLSTGGAGTSAIDANDQRQASLPITTSGGPVLIMASLSGFSTNPVTSTTIWVTNVANGIVGNNVTVNNQGGSKPFTGSIVTIDTPAAGPQTYNLNFNNAGNTTTINSYSLVVVELKK